MEETTEPFENELGNSIQINVSKKDITGVAGILISIIGPDSDTEMHITLHEAEILYERLGSALSFDR